VLTLSLALAARLTTGLALGLALALGATTTTGLGSGSSTGTGCGRGGHSCFYMERRDSCRAGGCQGRRMDRQVGHLFSPEARQEERAAASNKWKQGVRAMREGDVRGSMVMGQTAARAMASRMTAS